MSCSCYNKLTIIVLPLLTSVPHGHCRDGRVGGADSILITIYVAC
jgi:hypothetical protein